MKYLLSKNGIIMNKLHFDKSKLRMRNNSRHTLTKPFRHDFSDNFEAEIAKTDMTKFREFCTHFTFGCQDNEILIPIMWKVPYADFFFGYSILTHLSLFPRYAYRS